MTPIHGERGKQYYAIKCGNRECRESLILIEIPAQSSWEEDKALRGKLLNLNVRCLMCAQETPILERQLFVLDVR
jgi:hypothetical protein